VGHDLRHRALRAEAADGEPRHAAGRQEWTGGEPRGILLRFSLTPIEGERACIVETQAEFEVQSLGWLVKYFLKHHPEIQHGIFPGITLVLLDSIRRATE
jgi:hypothetical protein